MSTIEVSSEMKANVEDEVWKESPYYPNYRFSSKGRITTLSGRLSVAKPERNGYVRVKLTNNTGSRHFVLVHRAIALVFIGPPFEGAVVDHLNRIRHDNSVGNLRYVTHSQNTLNRCKTRHRAFEKAVYQVNPDTNTIIQRFESRTAAARHLGIDVSNIGKVLHGRKRTAGGFAFQCAHEQTDVLEREEWKTIEIENENFDVSTFGRVRGQKKIISYGYRHDGYLKVKRGGCSMFIHRLVMLAFLPHERSDVLDVNHIDNNGENNHVSNLEWLTHRANMVHGAQFRKPVDRHSQHQSIPVDQFTLNGDFIQRHSSGSLAAECMGVHPQAIWRAVNKPRATSRGFVWKKATDDLPNNTTDTSEPEAEASKKRQRCDDGNRMTL
jgi:hypothetical protein